MNPALKLVECPRDAFQGLPRFIPTERKVAHLRRIIDAGLTEIDFGSFVSPKAIPQMADTEDVLRRLADEVESVPRLIAIIANEKGLDRATTAFDPIRAKCLHGFFVGYPLSAAEGFQQRNTGKSIGDSWPVVEALQRRSAQAGIGLVVYVSMAFGNPDGEPWSAETVTRMVARLADLGVTTISLADTIGAATAPQVHEVLTLANSEIGNRKSEITLGAHFHAAPGRWLENVRAAYDAGCRRFDTSLGGYGGCPFAKEELVGNIPTEHVVDALTADNIDTGVNRMSLAAALASARDVFNEFGK